MTKSNTEVANTKELDTSALEAFNNEIETTEIIPFAAFSGKTGEFTYGFDAAEITSDMEVYIGAKTIVKGFICWESGELMYDEAKSIFDPEPLTEDDCPEIKKTTQMDGCKPSKGVTFIIDGEPYAFKISSAGGDKLFKKLTAEILKQNMVNKEYINPIVLLSNESYGHKTYKSTIYNPIATIVGWCNDKGERLVEQAAVESDS